MNEVIHSDTSTGKSGDHYKPCAKAIDLNSLRVFVAVADSAGFSAAANKLGMPKWSVSRSVSGLEAAMGVPLLHRTTRRVTLSRAGAALHAHIAPWLSSLDFASREWQEELGEPTGDVRIAISNILKITPIGVAIAKFTARYPAVRVYIHFANLINETAAEGYDIAIQLGFAQLQDSFLLARRGWFVFSQLFASPEYLAKQGTPSSLTDLAHHECVFYPKISSMPMKGANWRMLFKPSGNIHSNDVFFVREMLRSNAGIGLLPTSWLRMMSLPVDSSGCCPITTPSTRMCISPSLIHVRCPTGSNC
ncbi:MAG: LysR family transcriptional regulator [Gammaproteobacteria bacterium]